MNKKEQKSIIAAKASALDAAQIATIKDKINSILMESMGKEYELDEMKISVKNGDDKGIEIPFHAQCRTCYYPDGTPYLYCGGGECPS